MTSFIYRKYMKFVGNICTWFLYYLQTNEFERYLANLNIKIILNRKYKNSGE